MRTYGIAQGTRLSLYGNLNGKEIQKKTRGAKCVCIADSSCCRFETNTTL